MLPNYERLIGRKAAHGKSGKHGTIVDVAKDDKVLVEYVTGKKYWVNIDNIVLFFKPGEPRFRNSYSAFECSLCGSVHITEYKARTCCNMPCGLSFMRQVNPDAPTFLTGYLCRCGTLFANFSDVGECSCCTLYTVINDRFVFSGEK